MHTHTWFKTGEYHPTCTPIYFYVCECGAWAKACDGEPIRHDWIEGVLPKDELWYKWSWEPAMQYLVKFGYKHVPTVTVDEYWAWRKTPEADKVLGIVRLSGEAAKQLHMAPHLYGYSDVSTGPK